jgi:hypothetical protein
MLLKSRGENCFDILVNPGKLEVTLDNKAMLNA